MRSISRAVAALSVMALPLLAACGASSAPQGSPAAPATSPAAVPRASAAPSTTPSPSTNPSDDTADVQAASTAFAKEAFTLGYPDREVADYSVRVRPLMTKRGYEAFTGDAEVEKALTALQTRYGKSARSTPHLRGKIKVSALSTDKATARVTFDNRLQQRSGSTWKTVKTSDDLTGTLTLVHDGGTWLVDDAT